MLTYRKTTKREDETYGFRCNIKQENGMQCGHKVTRVCNSMYWCEGHFQVMLQKAKLANPEGDQIIDLDAPSEEITGKSEPGDK